MTSQNNNNQNFQVNKLFDVSGKVALITGGGSGIGLMATQALAVNGAKVYICGRTSEKLDRVAKIYGQDIPGQIIPITADVSKKDEIKKLVDEISSREKCLCILINNAGIGEHQPFSTLKFYDFSNSKFSSELNTQETEASSAQNLAETLFNDPNETFETWTDTYRTNVAQLFFMTTAFLPLLQKATDIHPGYSGESALDL